MKISDAIKSRRGGIAYSEFLDKLPDDEVYTIREISERMGKSFGALHHWLSDTGAKYYVAGGEGGGSVVGNATAICRYRKQMGVK